MSPKNTIPLMLSFAILAALAAPAVAGYVDRSIRAVAAEPPLPPQQASQGETSPGACWRHLDDVLIDPATGLRNCEAGPIGARSSESVWLGGPSLSVGGPNPSPNMSPRACWRHPDNILANPTTGRRDCED